MQNTIAWVFFILFGVTLFGMYILIRRRIGATSLIGSIGVTLSIVSFMLFTLAQGNTILWAIVIGVVIGGLFSGTALLVARYFALNEERKAQFDPYAPPVGEDEGQ